MSFTGIKNEYYYCSGKLFSSCFVCNDVKEGEYREFYENSDLKVICNYINGKKEGEYKEYYKNNLILMCNYINGKKEGEQITYIIFNTIIGTIKCNYKNDNLNGEYKEYDEDDILIFKCNYINGEKDGYQKKFNKRGELKSIKKFIMGIELNKLRKDIMYCKNSIDYIDNLKNKFKKENIKFDKNKYKILSSYMKELIRVYIQKEIKVSNQFHLNKLNKKNEK